MSGQRFHALFQKDIVIPNGAVIKFLEIIFWQKWKPVILLWFLALSCVVLKARKEWNENDQILKLNWTWLIKFNK